MKEMKSRRIITLKTVLVYLALFFVSSYALLEHVSVSISAFSQMKMPLLIGGAVCLISQLRVITKNLLRRKYFFVFLAVCLLCLMLLVSMYVNLKPVIGVSPVRNTMRLILYMLEMFFVTMVLAETGRGKGALVFLFWYLLILLIVNDFLLFTRLITFRADRFEGFLLGNKFSVSYLHIDLLALWAAKGKKAERNKKFSVWSIALVVVLAAAVAIRVDCITGVLGCVFMLVLFVLIETPKRRKVLRFSSPALLALALIASVMFVIAVDGILSLPFVENLIENVLKRDTTLTGRTNIYGNYIEKVADRWLIGFGYGNGNLAAESLFGYANVQNALLQWVLQVGVFATGALLFLMVQIFRQANRKKEKHPMEVLALVVLIYVYIILGTVETTFNMAFIMWFLLIFALVNERQKQPAQQQLETASVNGRFYQAGPRVRR